MVSVLLRLKSSGILDEFPNLAAYLATLGDTRHAMAPSTKTAYSWTDVITLKRNQSPAVWLGQLPRLPAISRHRYLHGRTPGI